MKNISFPNGHLLINGVELTHFGSDDDVVKFERNADSVTYKVGADGRAVVSHSADKSGMLTVKMQPTSPSNAYLMGLCNLQEGGPGTFVPMAATWQDTHRKDVVAGLPGCIVKPPDFQRGMDSSGNDMEWKFFFERLDMVPGNPIAFASAGLAAAEAAGG